MRKVTHAVYICKLLERLSSVNAFIVCKYKLNLPTRTRSYYFLVVRFHKAMTRTVSNWIYIQIIGMACFNAQAGTWLICFQGSLINVIYH